MRHASLFSGIGGFDLAAQWMNWTNVFHTEWNEFGQKILQHHFPQSISYHDIIKTDFTIHRNEIDIITGGFPCQPFSNAGKRKGTDDERYLWHEMLRAIQQIRPTYVVAENVRGLLTIDGGMVFEQVCADLEAEGYEVQPILLPAAGVNAPHRRDRIFIVGYAANTKNIGLAQSTQIGCEREECQPYNRNDIWNSPGSDGTGRSTANTNDTGTKQPMPSERTRKKDDQGWQGQPQSESWKNGINEPAANTNFERWEECNNANKPNKKSRQLDQAIPSFERWEQFPIESPICGRDDGIPDRLDNITFPKWRNESIKAYGNAVVPQLILPIFQTIEKLHREKK